MGGTLMRRSKVLLLSGVILALSCLQDRCADVSGTETVGRFAFQVWSAMGHHPVDEATAVTALRRAGVDLGQDVNSALTRGRAAGVLRDLGIKVMSPTTSAAPVSAAQAKQIVRVVLGRNLISKTRRMSQMHDCHVSTSDPEDCDDQGGDGDQGGGEQ